MVTFSCTSSSSSSGDGKNKDTVTDRNGALYDLFAVTNHYGRLGFGHYTSCARDWSGMYDGQTDTSGRGSEHDNGSSGSQSYGSSSDSNSIGGREKAGVGGGDKLWNSLKRTSSSAGDDVWHSYDDNLVTRIDAKEVQTRAAYILFYRKRPPNCHPASNRPDTDES